ncbi:hypothetical protein SAMN04488073_2259 [Marinobacter gudaonensis]|uniref:Uncharacterized protein n=1 Tax=Marinobacter gudaonensis TaxID=375760 RepID=A0A1I6H4P8_9GAMM|nr:hypothetical protein [Marinobacter gudaonensis]SFR49277.1 hypothetical protein SAMN04488073_2259 [Marinobacter gudaonensis]
MKSSVVCGLFFICLISGCASFKQPTKFRTSNDIVFKLDSSEFDTVDIQPSEIQLWRDSKLVGSVMTMDTNPEFSTAVEELMEGYQQAQNSAGDIRKLVLNKGVYGFSATINGYTTAFIATSRQPSQWITISADEDIFDQVLSTLREN